MRIASLTGLSGSGKTTLITQLIRHFIGQGESVGAIKHTHHPLNEDHRGDTARFREAGAEPVILAGDREAVLFKATTTERIAYETPRELIAHFDTDVVLIEGFKELGGIEIRADARPPLEELIQILDRIWSR
ncbi:MAG TPA: molybdopterin-guanine dinucleotide biosynthesis protein B [Thermoanaerobaculia bacterium]|nr:molybdopterin-guanine dinucleotide biosynthesis protein B [Thermoanaerobaculia bacterium]